MGVDHIEEEPELEGTLVLEKLALIDEVDAFLEAVDADDFARAKFLMKRAGVDSKTMSKVLKEMGEQG